MFIGFDLIIAEVHIKCHPKEKGVPILSNRNVRNVGYAQRDRSAARFDVQISFLLFSDGRADPEEWRPNADESAMASTGRCTNFAGRKRHWVQQCQNTTTYCRTVRRSF